jgi:radical SAM/Cys-rich protein
MQRTLARRQHPLTVLGEQRRMLRNVAGVEAFEDRIRAAGLRPFRAEGIRTFQLNLGKMCNQVCVHCHVDAGPDRKEIMTRETMRHCLDALAQTEAAVVDLTGGAPEMNPDFRWLVEQITALDRGVMVRSNLTILVANGFDDIPAFLAEHGVVVVASLPCYGSERTDAQRGDGVFDRSIRAIRRLNALGYGRPNSGLELHLVYNPTGPSLPPEQACLEADYKRELKRRHGVVFNRLFTITNVPINRYLDFLIESGNYEDYMRRLVEAFNPQAARNVMCRTMLSIGWDGRLYDCDFNQMLDLDIDHGQPGHIRDFDPTALAEREICTGNHCYACTAGAGSSCTGATT